MNRTPTVNLPRFTIVVPTYDRPGPLRACLEALQRLDYPSAHFEVIVVDDGSPTPLDAVVDPFRERLNLKLLSQCNAGPAAARNTGAAQATGDYLAFTDDDCLPDKGWLRAFAAAFHVQQDAMLGGRIVNALVDNLFAEASQQLITYLYGYYNREPERSRFFTSNNLAVPTGLFREIGGFDVTELRATAEDRELCDRWHHLGMPMRYVRKACVRHAHDLTLRSFLRQHFNYGRGALYFHLARRARGYRHIVPEPLTFYRDLVRFPLSQGQGSWVWGQVLLLVASQLANAVGFFYESLRRAHRSVPAQSDAELQIR